MRRSYLVLAIVMFSFSLFSCTTDSLADATGEEIETLATEGEDEDIIIENGGN